MRRPAEAFGGYNIFNRYRQEGACALCDRSRRPVGYANQLPEQVERLIVEAKRDKPHWRAQDQEAACPQAGRRHARASLSAVLAGHRLGTKEEEEDGIWLVSFMQYDLGYTDLEQRTLQTIDNPFGTRLSPMS